MYLSLDAPVHQTLLKGLEAAPNLIPVTLPDNVPVSEFSPGTHGTFAMEEYDVSDTTSDSETESDEDIDGLSLS